LCGEPRLLLCGAASLRSRSGVREPRAHPLGGAKVHWTFATTPPRPRVKAGHCQAFISETPIRNGRGFFFYGGPLERGPTWPDRRERSGTADRSGAGLKGETRAFERSRMRSEESAGQGRAPPGFYSRPDDHLSSGFLSPFVRYGLQAVEYRLGFTREAAGIFSPRTR
jgi:hypothetical protein